MTPGQHVQANVEPAAKVAKTREQAVSECEQCVLELLRVRRLLQRREEHLQIALSALRDVYMQLSGFDVSGADALVQQMAALFEIPLSPS